MRTAIALQHPSRSTWRDVVSLFKLRIGVLIMATALVGLAVTPARAPGPLAVIVLALAVLVASAAAGAFNQYVEYESDRTMARTRKRAFATGALPHHPAWLVLMALMLLFAVIAAWMATGFVSAVFTFLGAIFYGVVYTLWLKRRTAWNIVIGGLAGSFAVLAGAAAADPVPGPLALCLALVLFLWTPPHFWSLAIANARDYEAAGVPMLPIVAGTQRAAWIVFASTVALFAASLVPLAFGAGLVYAIGAGIGGLHFVRRSWQLARSPDRASAMRSFFASLVQLSLLLIAATIDGLVR